MGDRLHVEILDSAGQLACDDCERDIELTFGANDVFLERGGLSIGVADTEQLVRVHARLYRGALSSDPVSGRTQSAIDVVARLPPFTRGQYENALKFIPFPLPISCLGHPPDLAAGTTCQLAADGTATHGAEPTLTERDGQGSFQRPADSGEGTDCTRDAPAGMSCVGGGAFMLGDQRYEALAFDYSARPELGVLIMKGVALMLDTDEMTVGAVRKLVKQGAITVTTSGPESIVQQSETAGSLDELCTYLGPDDARNDARPLNCVSRNVAAAVCKAMERRLPTEAEWEFAAGNGVEETIYPWGNFEESFREGIFLYDEDDVVCRTAIVGRGRSVLGESAACKRARGPVAGGSAFDVTHAGVKNLGGNLSEWVSGELGFYDEPCWASGATCTVASPRLEQRMIPHRGGSWARSPQSAVAIARFARPDGPSPYVGFRCAVTENELP